MKLHTKIISKRNVNHSLMRLIGKLQKSKFLEKCVSAGQLLLGL